MAVRFLHDKINFMDFSGLPAFQIVSQQFQRQDAALRLAFALVPHPVTPQHKQIILDLCAQVSNWQQFLFWVRRHRINNVALTNLEQCQPEGVPDFVWASLRKSKRAQAMRSMQILDQTIKIYQTLRTHGVTALIIKGAVLSQQLFGQFDLRSYSDIDILVDKNDLEPAEQIILAAGYERFDPHAPLTSLQRSIYLFYFHHFVYKRKSSNLALELHWSLREYELISREATLEMLQRCQPVQLGSLEIKTLSPADMLVFAMVQGATDQWFSAKLFLDVLGLLQQPRQVDWECFIETVHKEKLEKIATQTFLLIQAIFGILPPERVISALIPGSNISSIVTQAANTLFEANPSVIVGERLSRINMAVYIMQLKSGLQHRLHVLASLNHSPQDWADLPLPDSLFFFYPMLRPFLWIKRHWFSPSPK